MKRSDFVRSDVAKWSFRQKAPVLLIMYMDFAIPNDDDDDYRSWVILNIYVRLEEMQLATYAFAVVVPRRLMRKAAGGDTVIRNLGTRAVTRASTVKRRSRDRIKQYANECRSWQITNVAMSGWQTTLFLKQRSLKPRNKSDRLKSGRIWAHKDM